MACPDGEQPKISVAVQIPERQDIAIQTTEEQDVDQKVKEAGVQTDPIQKKDATVQVSLPEPAKETASDAQTTTEDLPTSVSELHQYCKKWMMHEGKRTLKILVVGQLGSGKSALINALLGQTIATEGDSPTKVTTSVLKYYVQRNGVDVTIFDTPGLLDPSENDQGMMKKIQRGSTEIDLVLFCKKMTSRVDTGDVQLMTNLTHMKMWDRSVVVLTFANEVKLPRRRRAREVDTEPLDLETHFSMHCQQMTKALRDLLIEKVGISSTVAAAIPVVPAGYSDSAITGCSNWLLQLWEEVFKRVDTPAKSAWINVCEFVTIREERTVSFKVVKSVWEIDTVSNFFKTLCQSGAQSQ